MPMDNRIIDVSIDSIRGSNDNKIGYDTKEISVKNGNSKWNKPCDECFGDIKGTASLNKQLCHAAKSGHRHCMRLLIKMGADVNHSEKCPKVALTVAAENGLTKCVKELIKAGADVNATDFLTSDTALGAAAYNGREACVKLLINSGADVNKQVRTPRCPPILLAARKGHSECVDLLVKAGVDVNASGRISTPLIEASRHGSFKCVNLLLDAGADVNYLQGTTALMQAAAGGYTDCMHSLIAAGADVNKPNKSKSTALLFAGEKHIESVRVLLAAGAEVNRRNYEGHNALTYHMDRHRYLRPPDGDICALLLAAGETSEGTTNEVLTTIQTHEFSTENENKLDLMHQCRKTIRDHLLQLNNMNLFITVPKLGLPPTLSNYLVYNLTVHSD